MAKLNWSNLWHLRDMGHLADLEVTNLYRPGLSPPDKNDIAEILVEHSLPLRDLFDENEFVIRHELKKNGIDPGAIRVVVSQVFSTLSFLGYHTIILNDYNLSSLNTDEELYVLTSHELAHFLQMASGKLTEPHEARQHFVLDDGHFLHIVHSGDRHAVETGVGQPLKCCGHLVIAADDGKCAAAQYEDYYKRLTDERTRREQQASPMRTPRRGGSTTRPLDNPESERVWAVVPALSRRPVEVRKHLRRLKFK